MKILFVTPRLPLPADTGAKIRTYNLLKNAATSNNVSLLSFYFEKDGGAVEKLRDMGINVHLVKAREGVSPFLILSKRPMSIEKYRSKDMTRKLKDLSANGGFDLVHFDHLHMGQYKNCLNGKPSVLDDHNVESVLLERCARISRNIIRRQLFKSQARKMAAFEAGLGNRVNRWLVVSDAERDSLSRLLGQSDNIEVVPNGVDTEYFRAQEHPSTWFGFAHHKSLGAGKSTGAQEEESLVFTGSMDWLPNSDAVEYFCHDILPLIWEKKDKVKFYIVGKNPPKRIRELGKKDERIVVVGRVDDVRPYLEKSRIFVAPIRIGGGTRLKILEAMAMQKAVVSTTLGAEGIDYTDGADILLADEAQDFADRVIELLSNDDKSAEIGSNGRKLVCEKYDWKIIGRRLDDIYGEIADARQG